MIPVSNDAEVIKVDQELENYRWRKSGTFFLRDSVVCKHQALIAHKLLDKM